MTQKDWEKFSQLLDKIVNETPGQTWQDKALFVQGKMSEMDSETSLSEFSAWMNFAINGG